MQPKFGTTSPPRSLLVWRMCYYIIKCYVVSYVWDTCKCPSISFSSSFSLGISSFDKKQSTSVDSDKLPSKRVEKELAHIFADGIDFEKKNVPKKNGCV